MNQEIKQRLEMIQKGEVPNGYKQTKIGIIPNDWKVEKLGELFEFQNGANTEKSNYGSGIKFINVMDIFDNTNIKYDNIRGSVNLDEKIKNNFLVKKGDILFNRTSEIREEIGFTSVYIDEKEVIFGGFVIKGSELGHNFNLDFKQYCFFSDLMRKQIISKGQGAIRANIGQKDLEKIVIGFPSLPEQTGIAEILSNQDNLIELKEKLLEEKKNLKKSLMQNLLTGKVRFKEFNDGWKEVKLKKLLKEISNRNKENQVKRVLSVTNKKGFVNQDEYFGKEIASKDISNYKIVSRGEFAYNPSRINVGSIDLLTSFENGILSPMYVIFKTKDNLNPIYFRYWLDTHQFKGRIESFVAGSVRDSLAFKDMSMMKILLPSLPEQEKIANALQNQDKEISLLQEEINQLKLQKKSLMQLLLTGIVRVSQNVIPSKVINCGLKMEVEQ